MSEQSTRPFSRRAVITTVAATAGAAAGGALVVNARGDEAPRPSGPERRIEPFHGAHQAGIATPQQRHALFVAFDLEDTDPVSGDRLSSERLAGNFRRLMERWTAVAERLTQGRLPGPMPGAGPQVPPDTGIADGLEPSRLTVTFGLGPDLFERVGRTDARPHRLEPLPAFRGDGLEDAWSGGELLIQICGEDLQVISRAFRALRSRAPGLARLRWTQQGFLGGFGDATPRNLFGHKDGTVNPRPEAFDAVVWADAAEEPAWFSGGTYLVFRKIRMDLPKWDTVTARVQDETIGRRRDNGAPLSGGHEFSTPDFGKKGPDGKPLIPADSHLALVRDVPMLRRSYNYDYGFQPGGAQDDDHEHDYDHEHDDGHDHGEGMPAHDESAHAAFDSGVLFCAYVRDPGEFVRAQNALAGADRLNAFIRHTGSAVFAIPPGAAPGEPVAAKLFPRT